MRNQDLILRTETEINENEGRTIQFIDTNQAPFIHNCIIEKATSGVARKNPAEKPEERVDLMELKREKRKSGRGNYRSKEVLMKTIKLHSPCSLVSLKYRFPVIIIL